PEAPVVREEVRDIACVDRFAVATRRSVDRVAEEQDVQIDKVLAGNVVDLQLLEDEIGHGDRGIIELEPPVPWFLSKQHVVTELQLVEKDVDVESIVLFVIDEPPVAEKSIDHLVGPELEAVEHLADGPRLARVPHQVEVGEEGHPFLHPSDPVQEFGTLRTVQRVHVDGQRAQFAEDGPVLLRRLDDFSSFVDEFVFAKGHEAGFVWHGGGRGCGRLKPKFSVCRGSPIPRESNEALGYYKSVSTHTRRSRIGLQNLHETMPLTSARRKGRGSTGDADVDVFARRGATATGEVQVFTRRASGLVRVMSPYSAFAYNVLNIGVIFPWVYITTLSVFPNANVWAGIIVTGIFTGFLAVVYAGLASAMPRTGGDYVFQSRTLKPWLGFAIVSTMIITFFLQWQALGGWLVAVLGLSPMFLGLGLTTGNTMFIDWGIWFATPFGAMVTTMVTSTIAALVLIKSFRWFVKIQWVMWYGFLLSFVLMAVMFFLTPQATFIARYDRATQVIIGSSGLTYQQLLSTYFTPTTELSWVATLLVAPVALTSLGWVGYAQEQAG